MGCHRRHPTVKTGVKAITKIYFQCNNQFPLKGIDRKTSARKYLHFKISHFVNNRVAGKFLLPTPLQQLLKRQKHSSCSMPTPSWVACVIIFSISTVSAISNIK